jgi:NitT/TauT family transport system substrate-binding protein
MDRIRLSRRALLGAGTLMALAPAGVCAAALPRPEKSRISLGVVARSELPYLPLVVAEQLGYFRAEGLELDLVEGGSAPDVVCGPFEQVLKAHGRSQPEVAFALLGRTPAVALGVSTRAVPEVRSASDLRGKRIGIVATGSTSHLMAKTVLLRAGVAPADMQFIGVGGAQTASQALRGGQVDALCSGEPAITMLEQRAELRIVSDARTVKGSEAVFGGPMPAVCLHAPTEFVQRHPGICQVLADGIVQSLKWLQTAGPRDILRTVPEAYLMGDLGLYLASFERARESLSPDGLLPAEGARTGLRAVAAFDLTLRADRVDLARSYTNVFVQRARERLRK